MGVEYKGPGAWIDEIDANPSVADLSGNKTLFIESLTSDPPKGPKIEKVESLKHAFETFQPKKKLTFETADGSEVTEEVHPRSLTDFGKDGLIKQSKFLKGLNQQNEELVKIGRLLKTNRSFQKLLEDKDAKDAYVAAIALLINQIETAEKG